MPSSDTKPDEGNEPSLDGLLHQSQKIFGELLRQICELCGFTQRKLSLESKRELARLIEKGIIPSGESIGSMEQPTISNIITGKESPTYVQVYIWLTVIKDHFNSSRFAAICEELRLPLPHFEPEWEQALWRLARFLPPDELRQVCQENKDRKLIEISHQPPTTHEAERGHEMTENDVFSITFEDVEETAEEFGRIALHLPEHQMIIVLDNILIGPGMIKQFEDTPYGRTLARRWAVRMNESDETSEQPFEELRAEYLADISFPEEKDTPPPIADH